MATESTLVFSPAASGKGRTCLERPNEFSFACAGWLQAYLFGVAKCLQVHDYDINASFVGSSAGALAACGLVLQVDFDRIMEWVVNEAIEECHSSVSGAFKLRKYVTGCLAYMNVLHRYEEANGRLQVHITELPRVRGRRVQHFDSEASLHTALLASCTATPLAGLPFLRQGTLVMDGGVTDFQPMLGPNSITVNPFYFTKADIKPSRYVPVWWSVYPPGRDNYMWLYRLGYCDALDWMDSRCHQHHPCCDRQRELVAAKDAAYAAHVLGMRLGRADQQGRDEEYSIHAAEFAAAAMLDQHIARTPAGPHEPSSIEEVIVQPTELRVRSRHGSEAEEDNDSSNCNHNLGSSHDQNRNHNHSHNHKGHHHHHQHHSNQNEEEQAGMAAERDVGPSRYPPRYWSEHFHCELPKCHQNQVQYRKKASEIGLWRLLGYSFGLPSWFSRYLDFMVMFLMFLIWRPLAFSLVYFELLGRTSFASFKAGLFSCLCAPVLACRRLTGWKASKHSWSTKAGRAWLEVRDHLQSLWSPSLFLHALPFLGTFVRHFGMVDMEGPYKNRAAALRDQSFFYRAAQHFLHK
eukprot:g42093.t1